MTSEPQREWTVAQAKAHLSEVLRLSETEGPQCIGARKRFVVVPETAWRAHAAPPRMPLGRWLVENVPRGTNLQVPDRHSNRETPFSHDDGE
ncbi:MAG: hypothetical protein OXI25_05525 [Chloroflexota bacterium]|nr:hypothetical protein [Chloroflexota bacterium]